MAEMRYVEEALTFACREEVLVGVLSKPEDSSDLGVLIIVGGPQYRVGSHRQFVLLARALASQGIPSLRFDHRGMGDATGVMHSFENSEPEIAAAIATLQALSPGVKQVVLWGLCDSASAALMYLDATCDPRVAGVVLLNPWVRSNVGLAKARIKHYYGQRLLERDFWVKFLRGDVKLVSAAQAFCSNLMMATRGAREKSAGEVTDFRDRMAEGLRSFPHPVLLILSGRDVTAKEFLEYAKTDPLWAGLLDRTNLCRHDLDHADHTFSSDRWRSEVERLGLGWLRRAFRSASE